MAAKPTTVKAYIDALPADRKKALQKVRSTINKHLPKGYKEGIQYGMPGWYVPHSLYPGGYHCDPKIGVPFAGLASQKNHMSLYLMCIYGSDKHRTWFEKAYAKSGKKLDMGKACVRFKTLDDLPLDVIGQAIARVPVKEYVSVYETMDPRAGGGSKRAPAKKKAAKKKAVKKNAAKKKAAKKKTPARKK